MTEVTIAVPYRHSDSAPREEAFRYIASRLEAWFPDFEFLVADSGHEVFNRSATRNKAVEMAAGQVVVICDADTVPQKDSLTKAIEGALEDNRLHLPYTIFRGLDETSTRKVFSQGADPHEVVPMETADWSVGGVWVISKEGWNNAGGMDERFFGWGYEDNAFYEATNIINGKTVRHTGFITHLWHPRPANLTFTDEYYANRDLYNRYRVRKNNAREMKRLLEEEGRRS